ncbi:DUF4007 family protein [Metabacillus dongyingensis]|uniref:DUF4007 family protein n=1 Tax=Metabacillus dongyingensis TaxID=2874282 RepID=UPI001CC0C0E6|nr:DUF4007 family protein [Metabacillus dongyingensis]UAL53608.1 DUF4007 family protein [Metabacillus dongyingensis]
MGYGQHQSFYLRDRWLNKAIKHLKDNERLFYDKDAFEEMGLGKNMVQSLRYWVVATGVVHEKLNIERKKIHHITPLGQLIFKYDKFLKYNDTASILHYEMVNKREPSTSWFWFFNILNETLISRDNLQDELIEWVSKNENKGISDRSLKRDIDCLIKLYTAGQNSNDPEEVIQSPLNKLGLLEEKRGLIIKRSLSEDDIGLSALMYILLDFKSKFDTENISVDDLVQKSGLWGKVFNMSRTSIVNALNKLNNHNKFPLKFIRTNNLDLIRIPDVSPLEFLEYEYLLKNGVK